MIERPWLAWTRVEGGDVQLQRGVLIAGIDPEVARAVARACHNDFNDVEEVAYRVKLPAESVASFLEALTAAGFLWQVSSEGDPSDDGASVSGYDTWPRWRTTISGNALTMASFLKPISRAKATALMEGVLERVALYNDDPGKLYLITELRAFGSYVMDAASLGDLDVAVTFTDRYPERDRTQAHTDYARASGRCFKSYIDKMFWPTKELLQTLRHGSSYINVHTEDISRFTSKWTVLYTRNPAPASRHPR